MANLGLVLRDEIARLAKKATKGQLQALRKATADYRHQIAALKRELASVQRALKQLGRAAGARVGRSQDESADETSSRLRFSAKGFAAKRQQLGISAADMAKLLGVSSLSVYNWENGKTKPRQKQLQAIAAVRVLGKRQAMASSKSSLEGKSTNNAAGAGLYLAWSKAALKRCAAGISPANLCSQPGARSLGGAMARTTSFHAAEKKSM